MALTSTAVPVQSTSSIISVEVHDGADEMRADEEDVSQEDRSSCDSENDELRSNIIERPAVLTKDDDSVLVRAIVSSINTPLNTTPLASLYLILFTIYIALYLTRSFSLHVQTETIYIHTYSLILDRSSLLIYCIHIILPHSSFTRKKKTNALIFFSTMMKRKWRKSHLTRKRIKKTQLCR